MKKRRKLRDLDGLSKFRVTAFYLVPYHARAHRFQRRRRRV